nr:FtsW/RodA/SpoVE family cell cycle protein [Apilactobacillus ozensis]
MFGFILTISLIYLKFFGAIANGAAGWINLGPINIQPAEVAKVYFIMRFARVIQAEDDKINDYNWVSIFKGRLYFSLFIVFFIFIQPDLGGAIINTSIIFIMILSSGIKWKKSLKILLFTIFLAFIFVFAVLYPLIKMGVWRGYQANRVISFIDPFKYHDRSGYQVINSYYALSNGGILGRGLGNSIQKKWLFTRGTY